MTRINISIEDLHVIKQALQSAPEMSPSQKARAEEWLSFEILRREKIRVAQELLKKPDMSIEQVIGKIREVS
ncbi:hypothetical protein [Thalassospira xiamenensis]|uniref:Uncharacterized protein n=1 Tax=Thalassospira xiamenensis TaxID=220697 RepID=A0A285TS37_9PROT|nr:hypothetical protein [Thalassospira xiamenensis]SOC26210.1 hypothetical protein SAMN05428964_10580 [Thalassospira xiamenensis]